ncbi:hypothetical protein MBLNU457_g2881t1 [Dothideomycetes sp. NU457]
MLFSVLLCFLLAALPRFSLGLLPSLLPAFRDDYPANSSVYKLSPMDDLARGNELANEMLLYELFDLPLFSALLLSPVDHSSSSADLVTIPSYAAWDPLRANGLTITIRAHLRTPHNASLDDVDNVVNNALIDTSIKPEGGSRQGYPALNTTGYDGIARWRVQRDVLVRPVWNAWLMVSFPGTCRGRRNINVTTDLNGDIRATIFLNLTACDSDPSPALYVDSSAAAPVDLSCPSAIMMLETSIHDDLGPVPKMTSATVLLVPPEGLTISSDIDDVLRVAEVWNYKQALLWLVGRPYQPWGIMPDILKSWDDGHTTHYHYTTDTISLNADFYVKGTERFYPRGSWDFRPFTTSKMEILNTHGQPFLEAGSDAQHFWQPEDEVYDARYHNLKRLIVTFPRRKFVFIGDTSTASTTNAYPRLALEYPDQVACILIRNTRATEPADWMSSDTYHFRSVPREKYFFFDRPEDLKIITSEHLNDVVAGYASGCFPSGTLIPEQSYHPSVIRGKAFWSGFRALYYHVLCNGWFPKNKCPFEHTYFNLTDYTEEDVQSWIGD